MPESDILQNGLNETPSETCSFDVHVSKEKFKFNAAHFVAFKGYRERLHGHNYRVSVRLHGSRHIQQDGYVIDFGDVKKSVEKVCKELNEHFLCPMLSDVLVIEEDERKSSVKITCEDGSVFVFPKVDCSMLPIVHATAEEIGVYLWGRILDRLDSQFLIRRGIHTMDVTVAEAPGQDATFRMSIPKGALNKDIFDVRRYINMNGGAMLGCPALDDGEDGLNVLKNLQNGERNGSHCGEFCSHCVDKLSKKLEVLVAKMNSGELEMTSESLKEALFSK